MKVSSATRIIARKLFRPKLFVWKLTIHKRTIKHKCALKFNYKLTSLQHEAGITARKIKHKKLSESRESIRLIINKVENVKSTEWISGVKGGNVNAIFTESEVNYATVINVLEWNLCSQQLSKLTQELTFPYWFVFPFTYRSASNRPLRSAPVFASICCHSWTSRLNGAFVLPPLNATTSIVEWDAFQNATDDRR